MAAGRFTNADRDHLACYATAWSDFFEFSAMVESDGPVSTSKTGATYPHAAVGLRNRAIARIKLFGDAFGLNPKAREKLSLGTPERDDELEMLSPPGQAYSDDGSGDGDDGE